MAGIIGNNLNTYEQLRIFHRFYAQEADSENSMCREDIETRTAYFLKENGRPMDYSDGIGPQASVPAGERNSLEQGISWQEKSSFRISPPRIFARQFPARPAVWFHTGRKFLWENGICILTFAMNLETIYQKIIAPVKIGRDGYSSVKDQNMCIIMHHAKDQIGLEAFDDRMGKYPELVSEQHECLD